MRHRATRPRVAILTAAIVLSVALAALGAPVPARAPATGPVVRVTETVLYTRPDGRKVADTVASPDARHVACIERRDDNGKFTVAVDDKRTPELEWVVGGSLGFSPDGGRICYKTAHDGKIFVAVGPAADPAAAVEGKGYFLVGRVLFSGDGKRMAYWAQAEKDGPVTMVLDGKESGSFVEVHEKEMSFSPDNKRLAFRALAGRKQVFVVDGVPGRPYDTALGLTWSDDGRRWAYRAKSGEETFVVLDGREGPRFAMVAGLTFPSGGRRFAYVAGRGQSQMLVIDSGSPGKPDAKEYKAYDGLADLAFSPDGRRVAITVKVGEQWKAVVDGKESPPYDGTGRFMFSPDSRRFAYAAGRGQRQFVVVDGVEGPSYEGVAVFGFSPDSKRFAYTAVREGRQALVVDGKEGPLVDVIGVLTFSPEGSRFAYAAVRETQKVLMVDHQPTSPAGLFSFSPDGRHVAVAYPRGGGGGGDPTATDPTAAVSEKWCLAVNGVPVGPDCDGLPFGGRIVFDTPTTAHTVVGRGHSLYRVDIRIGP